MLEQIKLMTSRRSYEFATDELRLSTLCTQPVQGHIKQLFQFQVSSMGSPLPTFGDVPTTYPPGIVFDMGAWLSPEKQLIPIRFLHIEPRRIVIDVAGPSLAVTAIFEQLEQALSQLQAADGSPLLGRVIQVKDYSEISARFSSPIEALFPQPLRQLFKSVALADEGESLLNLTLALQKHSRHEELSTIPSPNDTHSFTFACRAGTKPEEQIYFSGAPLSSDTHLDYLRKLDAILSEIH